MLYMMCGIYAVSQRVFGYYNWHSSPLKAHTTHSKAGYYHGIRQCGFRG